MTVSSNMAEVLDVAGFRCLVDAWFVTNHNYSATEG